MCNTRRAVKNAAAVTLRSRDIYSCRCRLRGHDMKNYLSGYSTNRSESITTAKQRIYDAIFDALVFVRLTTSDKCRYRR